MFFKNLYLTRLSLLVCLNFVPWLCQLIRQLFHFSAYHWEQFYHMSRLLLYFFSTYGNNFTIWGIWGHIKITRLLLHYLSLFILDVASIYNVVLDSDIFFVALNLILTESNYSIKLENLDLSLCYTHLLFSFNNKSFMNGPHTNECNNVVTGCPGGNVLLRFSVVFVCNYYLDFLWYSKIAHWLISLCCVSHYCFYVLAYIFCGPCWYCSPFVYRLPLCHGCWMCRPLQKSDT